MGWNGSDYFCSATLIKILVLEKVMGQVSQDFQYMVFFTMQVICYHLFVYHTNRSSLSLNGWRKMLQSYISGEIIANINI